RENGDLGVVGFQITPLDEPPVLPSNFPTHYIRTDTDGFNGIIPVFVNSLELTLDGPQVVADTRANYEIIAFDGRVRSSRRLTIEVINVPSPPVWVQPSQTDVLVPPAKLGYSFQDNPLVFQATQEDN